MFFSLTSTCLFLLSQQVRKGGKREHSGRKLSKDRSGHLNNHPAKGGSVTSLERSKTQVSDLSDSRVERAIKDRSKSVYQVDYLGAPPGNYLSLHPDAGQNSRFSKRNNMSAVTANVHGS